MSHSKHPQAGANRETIEVAMAVAAAAGILLARMHTLLVGHSLPNARGFLLPFVWLTPWARVLTNSFPSIRSRFTGLVHRHVAVFGYRGSSALHVLAQIAGLIARAGEGCVPSGEASASPSFTMEVAERLSNELSDAQVAQLASDLREAVPFDVSNILHTMIEVEFVTLERQLGQRITQAFDVLGRPSSLDAIARKIGQYIQPPMVVHAPTFEMAPPARLHVDIGSKKVLITEGAATAEIRGIERVRLFKAVYEASPRDVRWSGLVDQEIERGTAQAKSRGSNTGPNPRMAVAAESLRRTGNRIEEDLGKLRYHWHQDGEGARWDDNLK